jgi:hypothetical protein
MTWLKLYFRCSLMTLVPRAMFYGALKKAITSC